MMFDIDQEKRYVIILEQEKRLLPFCVSGFVTCTELGMGVDDWLEYAVWKNSEGTREKIKEGRIGNEG